VHAEEYTLEVAAVVAFPVEAAEAALSAGAANVDWLAVEVLEVQVADPCHLDRDLPEAEALPVLLCKAGLSAAKGH